MAGIVMTLALLLFAPQASALHLRPAALQFPAARPSLARAPPAVAMARGENRKRLKSAFKGLVGRFRKQEPESVADTDPFAQWRSTPSEAAAVPSPPPLAVEETVVEAVVEETVMAEEIVAEEIVAEEVVAEEVVAEEVVAEEVMSVEDEVVEEVFVKEEPPPAPPPMTEETEPSPVPEKSAEELAKERRQIEYIERRERELAAGAGAKKVASGEIGKIDDKVFVAGSLAAVVISLGIVVVSVAFDN